MKLLFDQNLSPRLPKTLESLFPGSIHVRAVGLESADDRTVWAYAASEGFAIATRDSDFFNWAVLQDQIPSTKVVWGAVGNRSTSHIESLFRDHGNAIKEFLDDEQKTVFVLFPDQRHHRR